MKALPVGQELSVIENFYTPEDVAQYAYEVSDGSPRHRPQGDLPLGLHPNMLSTVSLRLLRLSFQADAIILAKRQETYVRPAWTGQQLVSRGKIFDKGRKRGRDFIDIDTTTCDEAGNGLVRRRTTLYLTVEQNA